MLIAEPIRSSRLLLRTLAPDDVGEEYLGWLEDPDIYRYLEVRFTAQTVDSVRRHVAELNASQDTLFLGMFLNGGGAHIGNIKLGPINPYHHWAPIGLIVGAREHWGKGYASDAIEALSTYAFGTLNLHRLWAGCYSANEGSRRAFLKVGYVEEGRLRDHWLCDGKWQDDVLLGLLNDAYEA